MLRRAALLLGLCGEAAALRHGEHVHTTKRSQYNEARPLLLPCPHPLLISAY